MPADVKTKVEAKVNELKEVAGKDDVEGTKKAIDELQKEVSSPVFLFYRGLLHVCARPTEVSCLVSGLDCEACSRQIVLKDIMLAMYRVACQPLTMACMAAVTAGTGNALLVCGPFKLSIGLHVQVLAIGQAMYGSQPGAGPAGPAGGPEGPAPGADDKKPGDDNVVDAEFTDSDK